jgi:hypothetical protein
MLFRIDCDTIFPIRIPNLYKEVAGMVKKALAGGTFLAILVIVVGMQVLSAKTVMEVLGGVGVASLLLAGLCSGAFVSGDRIRENFYMERPSDRKTRTRLCTAFILFGLPNLIAAVCIMYIIRY